MSESSYDQIPEAALNWVRAGRKAALATVVETWGSAPRPTGAQLAINEEAEMVGSVSGGCVEGAVVAEALEALEDGRPRMLEFGVTNEEAFAVGLACGGTIRVLVEPVAVGQGPSEGLLADLSAARAHRRPVVYAVNPATWERHLVSAGSLGELHEAVEAALVADRSGFSGEWFLGVHNPPLRLAVVGAVHIAQALVPMARIAGYDVAVIDPREAFASAARFPDTVLLSDWPDAALAAFGLDSRTAVVTLTHDPKLDDPAIRTALRSDVFYLGCLGSSRTHAKRVARLRDDGYSEDEIGRIHAPIGADIGAKSPAEIAVSILAQITERLRRPETRPAPRAVALA
jgi:xanthine dehydrogenase accessory factor